MSRFLILFLLLVVCGCSPHTNHSCRYHYLAKVKECERSSVQFNGEGDHFLVVLVDARHLDYSSPAGYLSTLQSLCSSQEPHTGHAWIILSGKRGGEPWIFEGGHTGEFGRLAPRYFDEMLRLSRNKDPNPAQYLFSPLPDGQLEIGSGGHLPTFAAAFPVTEEGFARIMRLFEADGYDFSQWGLRGPHCVHFVLSCLACVGIDIFCQEQVQLPASFSFEGERIDLWIDSAYSTLTTQTPELLEQRLVEHVSEGRALVATAWYRSWCLEKDKSGK